MGEGITLKDLARVAGVSRFILAPRARKIRFPLGYERADALSALTARGAIDDGLSLARDLDLERRFVGAVE